MYGDHSWSWPMSWALSLALWDVDWVPTNEFGQCARRAWQRHCPWHHTISIECHGDYPDLDFEDLGNLDSKRRSSTGVTRVNAAPPVAGIIQPTVNMWGRCGSSCRSGHGKVDYGGASWRKRHAGPDLLGVAIQYTVYCPRLAVVTPASQDQLAPRIKSNSWPAAGQAATLISALIWKLVQSCKIF